MEGKLDGYSEEVRTWCPGCGTPLIVMRRGLIDQPKWCSDACRQRTKRERRILVIAEGLETRKQAACDAALVLLGPQIERARYRRQLVAARIAQQQAEEEGGSDDDA